MVLASMSNQIQNKKKNLLRSLVVVSSQPLWQVSGSCPQPCFLNPVLCPQGHHMPICYPSGANLGGQTSRGPLLGGQKKISLFPQKIQRANQETLLQKTWNTRVILKYMDKFQEVSGWRWW